MFHIGNINTLKSIYFMYFHAIIKHGKFSEVILLTLGTYLPYKRKWSKLWLVHMLEFHVEIYLKS
jgi:hypothetical protein